MKKIQNALILRGKKGAEIFNKFIMGLRLLMIS